MHTRLRTASTLAMAAMVAVAMSGLVTGQDQAPARGQGRGRGAPPPPPPPQPGHPSGALVIWGDLVNFERPGTPNRCTAQSRYRRGARVGFRMTAIDGGSGEVENTAEMVAHVAYGGKTIDVPLRWRGVGPFPAAEYPRRPSEMWTGVWTVPDDAPVGILRYTVTATDRFGRTASFTPFPNHESQLTIVE
jgi:hypothetical protein